MPAAFSAQPYRDINNSGVHRGVVAVVASKEVDLGVGHNNFTFAASIKGGSADLDAGHLMSWDFHATRKGVVVITVRKMQQSGVTPFAVTFVAATASVNVSFVATVGASVIGG